MKSNLIACALLLCALVLAQAGCNSPGNSQTTETNAPAPEASAPPETGDGDDAPPVADEAENQPVVDKEPDDGGGEDERQVVSEEAQGLFQKGVEAYKRNRDAEAVEAFEQAIRVEPDFADAHFRLGLAYAATGRKDESKKSYEASVKAYKKLLQRKSKNADAHYRLGLAYDKLYKPEEAVKEFKEAVRYQTGDAAKYYELGLAHMKLAEYREAVAALNKSLDLDPDDYRAAEALDKAKAGLARREAFLKQQEKLDKRGKEKPKKTDNKNANANTNANAKTNANRNANR
ncbi:MAG TPA: tetratricopeptide repeat protein [Pyrinomonadaceae bacterium]|jgi:tetratricopeptide (TPR) repeat protein|nr:tetratricopeptide repeat protein [Pyrinomonadaceae bacterium]